MTWYNVSLFGWLFALLHVALSSLIVYGRVTYDVGEPAYYLYRAAFGIHIFLLCLFVYARYKKERIFAKK